MRDKERKRDVQRMTKRERERKRERDILADGTSFLFFF